MSLCTYCGEYDGNHRDHIIPISYVSTIRSYRPGSTVPACSECNGTLGDRMFITVPERAGYVYRRYSEKYKKLLSMPDWTFSELEVMSDNLRNNIETSLKHRDITKQRIEKLSLVKGGFDILTDIDHITDEQYAIAESNITGEGIEEVQLERYSINHYSNTGLSIHTPRGDFDTWSSAARVFQVTATTIKNWCKSKPSDFWYEKS